MTDLKELLAKHHLTQTGKKDDLVKRLMDNNVGVEDDGGDGDAEEAWVSWARPVRGPRGS